MSPADSSPVAFGAYAAGALAYAAFGLYLLLSQRLAEVGDATRRRLLGALAVSAAWALAWGLYFGASVDSALAWAVPLDLARYGLWLAFLQTLFPRVPSALTPLRLATIFLWGLAAAMLVWAAFFGTSAGVGRATIAVLLVLALCGLLVVEQLFRNLAEGSRWSAKPVCLALVCIFGFDIYLLAEALLLGAFDENAVHMRGAVQALAVPLLFVAARRSTRWVNKLQVSRAAAFYSATLILAGGYLLFMSAVGYYVRYFGGDWGRALQLGLLAAGLALLALLVFSGSVRSWLKVFVNKHFYSYRYDYREEWLRFTTMLSTKGTPQEVGDVILRGLSKMVECQSGSLWTRVDESASAFVQISTFNSPAIEGLEDADSEFCRFLGAEGWVVDLDEFRSSPRRYGALSLPTWLLGSANSWLVVPLMAGDALQGFVVLERPLTAIKLNWEVLDLLKTAGRQAASHLAQMQATEALLEARKFESFNRMSAFVVHDLKNIVAQLSLMLKNAERLRDNQEFQQDMLMTVESSLEKMRRLMLQLREGAVPSGGSRGVELTRVLHRLSALATSQGRRLEVDEQERLSTRGHEDRLERVLGHLVQNALDATPPSGKVWLQVSRHSGQILLTVGDTGAGMTEEFVRTRLFRPFNTTKSSGMGIGSYESFQYLRELGGSITVHSKPGTGTVLTVLLPLFEAQLGSDLLAHRQP